MTRTLTLPSGATVRVELPDGKLPEDADFVDLAEEGDDLEDEGDIEGAFMSYSEALGALVRDLDGAGPATADADDNLFASLVALLYNRAGLRFDLDDLEGALADLDAALAVAPDAGVGDEDLADVYVRRADARYADGHTDGADADLAEALRVWPDHALAYNNRAAYRLEGEDLEGALADAETAVRLDPEDALFLATLAEIHAARGSNDAALDALERAAALDDVSPFLASEHFEAVRESLRFRALTQGEG